MFVLHVGTYEPLTKNSVYGLPNGDFTEDLWQKPVFFDVSANILRVAVSALPGINRTELIAWKLHPNVETVYSANMPHRLPIRLRCSNLPNF